MRRFALHVACAAAMLIAIAPGAVGAGRAPAAMPEHGDGTAAVLSELRSPALEAAFLAAMIPHHQSAVTMATRERRFGANGELRSLAARIADGQRAEITRMKTWLGSRSLTASGALAAASADLRLAVREMDAEHAGDVRRLARLKGAALDRAFVTAMVPHHRSAVEMARALVAAGPKRPVALKAFGQAIVRTQSSEILLMQRLAGGAKPPDHGGGHG